MSRYLLAGYFLTAGLILTGTPARAQAPDPQIRVNQIGYYPLAPKYAVVPATAVLPAE